MLDTRFNFGENWKNYSESIDQSHLLHAKIGLQKLIPQDYDCRGKSFLDIGSGSGLHAVAASRLGFSPVVATDYDPTSVKTTQDVAKQFDETIEAFRDDILDSRLSRNFDVVYSWGVLHHTGDLAAAIEQSKALVSPGGLYIIAIYMKTAYCGKWKKIKRFYCTMPAPIQKMMAITFHAIRSFRQVLNGELFKNYWINRGMDRYRDSVDWLGGYPYESASPEEMEAYVGSQFTLLKSYHIQAGRGLLGAGCAEYVFKRAP